MVVSLSPGQNVVHSAVCVLVAWLLLMVIGGTLLSVIISFIFQMTYLLVGEYSLQDLFLDSDNTRSCSLFLVKCI